MDDNTKKILNVYAKILKKYGPNDAKSVAWNSRESQQIRYKVLSQVANLENQIILDVGSGLGDLAAYLKPLNIYYTGIEISAEMAKACNQKYPDLKIINDDFLKHNFSAQYDYILCCGSLNMEQTNHKDYVFSAIKKMFELSRRAAAFNLLSTQSQAAKQNREFDEQSGVKVFYMDPSEVFNYCKSLTPWVTLRHDYLPHDFTIYMYR